MARRADPRRRGSRGGRGAGAHCGEAAAGASALPDPRPSQAGLDADPGGAPVSADPPVQITQTADRLRDGFLVTLRELDRRRQRAMDVRGLLRDNRRVLVAAGAGVAALLVVVIGTSVALSRSRDS